MELKQGNVTLNFRNLDITNEVDVLMEFEPANGYYTYLWSITKGQAQQIIDHLKTEFGL